MDVRRIVSCPLLAKQHYVKFIEIYSFHDNNKQLFSLQLFLLINLSFSIGTQNIIFL